MSETSRALGEALELALRFSAAVDDGLLADIRRARAHPQDRASKDLQRIGTLSRVMFRCADELVSIAERWEERGQVSA